MISQGSREVSLQVKGTLRQVRGLSGGIKTMEGGVTSSEGIKKFRCGGRCYARQTSLQGRSIMIGAQGITGSHCSSLEQS